MTICLRWILAGSPAESIYLHLGGNGSIPGLRLPTVAAGVSSGSAPKECHTITPNVVSWMEGPGPPRKRIGLFLRPEFGVGLGASLAIAFNFVADSDLDFLYLMPAPPLSISSVLAAWWCIPSFAPLRLKLEMRPPHAPQTLLMCLRRGKCDASAHKRHISIRVINPLRDWILLEPWKSNGTFGAVLCVRSYLHACPLQPNSPLHLPSHHPRSSRTLSPN